MGIISLSTLDIILNSITNNMTQFDYFKSNFLEKKDYASNVFYSGRPMDFLVLSKYI